MRLDDWIDGLSPVKLGLLIGLVSTVIVLVSAGVIVGLVVIVSAILSALPASWLPYILLAIILYYMIKVNVLGDRVKEIERRLDKQ